MTWHICLPTGRKPTNLARLNNIFLFNNKRTSQYARKLGDDLGQTHPVGFTSTSVGSFALLESLVVQVGVLSFRRRHYWIGIRLEEEGQVVKLNGIGGMKKRNPSPKPRPLNLSEKKLDWLSSN